MTDELDNFAYLWDGSEEGWVIFRASDRDAGLVYNKINRVALLIEDEESNDRVCQRLHDAGAEVVKELPKST